MKELLTIEIGGYFGLDLLNYGDLFPLYLKYQSARSALRAVLEHVKATKMLLPAYICNSVIQAVIDAGVTPKFYYLDEDLFPKNLPDDNSDNFLLYINYFGLNDHNVKKLQHVWPNDKLIIDNSQALFAQPTGAIATIYSPRKFVGVPDGGMLYAPTLSMIEPDEEDTESIVRMRHLLIRAAYSARSGYSDYLAAEQTLEKTKPLAMSKITRRLLSSVNLQGIKTKRRENFQVISDMLNHYNSISLRLEPDTVPLCYPLILTGYDVEQMKNKMIQNNIFVPTYWQEVLSRVDEGSFEYSIVNNCLSLPCDQRYGEVVMNEIIVSIEKMLDGDKLK